MLQAVRFLPTLLIAIALAIFMIGYPSQTVAASDLGSAFAIVMTVDTDVGDATCAPTTHLVGENFRNVGTSTDLMSDENTTDASTVPRGTTGLTPWMVRDTTKEVTGILGHIEKVVGLSSSHDLAQANVANTRIEVASASPLSGSVSRVLDQPRREVTGNAGFIENVH